MDRPPLSSSEFPAPASTERPDVLLGEPVILGDGRPWHLAGFVPEFGQVWDRLYDVNLLGGRYELDDVQLAAARLLLANHEIPPDFAAWLITWAEPRALVGAIESALFGSQRRIRGWSDWAAAALWANGINPATIPPACLGDVLDQLVDSGRAVPHFEFTTAGVAASRRRHLKDQLRRSQINPTPPPAAPPKPELTTPAPPILEATP